MNSYQNIFTCDACRYTFAANKNTEQCPEYTTPCFEALTNLTLRKIGFMISLILHINGFVEPLFY